ncbi:MAG: aldehyde dehydrogenase family protein [Planctomycetota bacterium]
MSSAEAFGPLVDLYGLSDSGSLEVSSPVDGARLCSVEETGDVGSVVTTAHEAFLAWRSVPGPVRGELVRVFGERLRAHKASLSQLVTLECGKPIGEAEGEVQEMIDICDFAVGLSRQLYGLTMPSERPGHHLREMWHPLGVVGVISAFNFPVAVWAWNTALALVCGDSVVWKPSEKTPLTALACSRVFAEAATAFKDATGLDASRLCPVVIGGRETGQALVDDARVALVSATGSVPMGRAVSQRVAGRMGRCLLELGGNNAMIVRPSADLELAVRAIVFSAAGTAGQRCTTLRRLIVHPEVKGALVERLVKAYGSLRVGNPFDRSSHLGPLIDEGSYEGFARRIADVSAAGGRRLAGGQRVLESEYPGGYYVSPAIIEVDEQTDLVRDECFGPLMYVMQAGDLDEAIAVQNGVPQGLSSCIFTTDVRESERFLSAVGSDCGIANVNIGPSGAEIGGAFGGEKETGGGRESGSDAWKAYMRRQTQTVNYSTELPLAQGIEFEL